MRTLIGFLMVLTLAACQDKPKVATNEITPQASSVEGVVNKKSVETDSACLNKKVIKKSPPVRDKSKIKTMLLKTGKITSEMTDQEADKIVNDFIRVKQTPQKNCK